MTKASLSYDTVNEGNAPAGADSVRTFFEHAVDALFVIAVGLDGRFRFEEANHTFQHLVRLKLHDLRWREPHQILPFSAAATLLRGLRTCEGTNRPFRLEVTVADGDTATRWEFLLTPVPASGGTTARILGQGRGMSERHEQVARLERSQRLLERIAETTRDILYVFDRVEQRTVYMNRQAYQVIGYHPHELREMGGSLLSRLVCPDDLPRLLDHYRAFDTLADGQIVSIEYRLRHANGHYVWLSSRDTILSSDRYCHARRIIGCAVDITQQRLLQRDLKAITQKVLDTQDEERRRIAQELHDSTAQHLVGASLGLASIERTLSGRDPATSKMAHVRGTVAEVRDSLAQAQKEIRTLSYLLHPPGFNELGLVETLRSFISGYERRTGIRARLRIARGFSCHAHDIGIALLRIAQEALINVYRHADAAEAEVRLGILNGYLAIEIEDDGKGFPAGVRDEADGLRGADLGVGIPGMRARVQQLRGQLYLLQGRRGALIRATIPEPEPQRVCLAAEYAPESLGRNGVPAQA